MKRDSIKTFYSVSSPPSSSFIMISLFSYSELLHNFIKMQFFGTKNFDLRWKYRVFYEKKCLKMFTQKNRVKILIYRNYFEKSIYNSFEVQKKKSPCMGWRVNACTDSRPMNGRGCRGATRTHTTLQIDTRGCVTILFTTGCRLTPPPFGPWVIDCREPPREG